MEMTKHDKVMLAVSHCLRSNDCSHCEACPYNDGADYGCRARLRDDIIELLKAQEPVKPVFDAGDGKTIGKFLCGKCHAKIGFGHPHFCWYCGRAVKWDD